jgi:excisionase family DNA binding protein
MHENGLGASLRERLALRVNEAAAVTGLSRSTLYVLMRKGALRSVRVAGRRLIPRDALEALLQGGK